MGMQEGSRVVAGEGAIQPDQEQGRRAVEIGGEGMERIAVPQVGRHDLYPERVALGVDHQHASAAFDLLVGVIPARATLGAGSHARSACR